MRLLPLVLLSLLVPATAGATDPLVCREDDSLFLFACAGGGVEGACPESGYRFDEVVVATLAGYVVVIGDAQCSASGASSYHDSSLRAAAGTDAAAASVWWYDGHVRDPDNGDSDGCVVLLGVYSLVGPLVVTGAPCPAGMPPPALPWGELAPEALP